jgi:hypothetical protein
VGGARARASTALVAAEEKVQAGAASAGRYVPVGAACVMLLVGICCSCEGVLGVGE